MRKTRLYIPAGLDMLLLTGVFVLSALIVPSKVDAAACVAPSTDFGTVTSTVTIPSTGTYRIWSRIQAPSTSANTYLLEIDGNTCFNVGGNSSIPTNTWTWLDYHNGSSSTATKVSMNLTAGTHTVKMIGNKQDVLLDRVIFTQDTSCTPDHSFANGANPGDNCATPSDTTGPTLAITSPAAGLTVSGSMVDINATASDPSSVDKVEFFINNNLVSTDNTDNKSIYNFKWNTTSGYPKGSYTIKVKATDKSSNANFTERSVTVGVDNTVPLGPGDVGDDGTGTVGFEDLLAVLNNWNKTGQTRRQGDVKNNDGKVDFDDLLEVLNNWTK